MDINLPLVLVIVSFVGIVIVIYDFLILRHRRKVAIEDLKTRYPDWDKPGSEHLDLFDKNKDRVMNPWWVRETKSLLPIVLLVLVLRSFLAEPFQIPSSSMEPGLQVGDFILVNKFTYGIRLPVIRNKIIEINQPKRGDVMVFFPPDDDRYFIKRVVGLPGDVIEYNNKRLFINGEQQKKIHMPNLITDKQSRQLFAELFGQEQHLIFDTPIRPARYHKVTVPKGHYFMMGDNRDNSRDSRFFGFVPEEKIVGRAFFIWMHWKSWSSLPSFSRVGSIK